MNGAGLITKLGYMGKQEVGTKHEKHKFDMSHYTQSRKTPSEDPSVKLTACRLKTNSLSPALNQTQRHPRGAHLFLWRQTGDGHVGAADRLDLLDVLETIFTQQLREETQRDAC